jgi:hypothetical protein
VADENLILYDDAFRNEDVRLNFASSSYHCAALDLDKRAHPRIFADHSAVNIDELRIVNAHALTDLR